MLTLVSGISVHTIQSCTPMCGWHHKGQQSFSLASRCDVHVQQSFPHGQIVSEMKQHLAFFGVRMFTHACLKQSISFCGVTFFFILIHLQQAANNTSSRWASSQLVMCIDVNLRAWARISSSRQSHSALKVRLMITSPLSVMLVTAPSSRDQTVSGLWHTGTQLSTSAAVLSNPFWYSKLNLYDASAPTHQCPVASSLGVVNTYVRGLLSIRTINGA